MQAAPYWLLSNQMVVLCPKVSSQVYFARKFTLPYDLVYIIIRVGVNRVSYHINSPYLLAQKLLTMS
jgi:hypothetical protein